CLLFFFFQAEDGIRDFHVTGVQTCALPIWTRTSCGSTSAPRRRAAGATPAAAAGRDAPRAAAPCRARPSADTPGEPRRRSGERRSEERRVGKEESDQGSRDQ